jgi:hypothetical protein
MKSVVAQGRGSTAFWIVKTADGQSVSLYPVVVPTLIAPLYLPAVAYLDWRGWTDDRLDHVAIIMEKLTSSCIAALSVALLYLLLRRRASERVAVLLTVAYAFGTTTWVISSQALWQHGMGQLLLIVCLLVLTAECTTIKALAAGLFLGLLATNRPPDALLAAALGVYGLFWARRRIWLLAVGSTLPIGLVVFYNLHVTGNIAGAYGLMGKPSFFQHDLFYGIAGILFSPMRGLFVFSPFLLFLALIGPHLKSRREPGLTLAMLVCVFLQIILYAKADWRAGISWGPRYMTDLLPILVWLLAPAVSSLRTFGRVCFIATVVVSGTIEGIGAFCYTGATDLPLYEIADGPGAMRAAWDWRNAPFIASLRYRLSPLHGSFDGVQFGSYTVNATRVGADIEAFGWASAGEGTPYQIAIRVDDQTQLFTTRSYFDRDDIRATLHEKKPVGWRISVNTMGLAPGEHRLTAFAWVTESSERRFLGERYLTLKPAVATVKGDLEASARTAVERLHEHQQPAGYWLTFFTKGTKFEAPSQELNTFLTSLLVDWLNPMESSDQLGDSLKRARQFLTNQIEPSGLVRYHGLPTGPGIGTLGCVITPDADDTSLVWRLAPGDLKLRSDALAILKQYRTDDGLYRTWLAPQSAYQCLNPGRDPNPADLTIQMHVLLLFAQTEPAAANTLCKALRPVVGDQRVWVYYSNTPLVPMIRLKDLQDAGCKLDLPQSRINSSLTDQAPWISLASLLRETDFKKRGSAIDAETLLRQIASNDFAFVRRNPPLLYHNDLTASVSRYYWSEDAGYALWLRLYYEYPHPLTAQPIH